MCNLGDAIEEEGIQKGKEQKLVDLICQKVRKGKSLEVIVEELEEEVSDISPIYDAVLESAPDYDSGKVYEEYKRMKARIELLEILSEAEEDVKNGRVASVSEIIDDLRKILQEG